MLVRCVAHHVHIACAYVPKLFPTLTKNGNILLLLQYNYI